MEELPEHVQACPYCLTRLRNITQALRDAMTDSPLPLWGEEPLPSLVFKLSKATRWIQKEGRQIVADVLVVIEAIADKVNVERGGWIMLAPVPAGKGIAARHGATRSLGEAEMRPEAEGDRHERLEIECQPSVDILLSGQIVCSEGRAQALLMCLDPRSRRPCAGVFHIEYSLDGAVPQSVQAGVDATAAIDLPQTFGVAIITVFRQGQQVGAFRIELEPEKADG